VSTLKFLLLALALRQAGPHSKSRTDHWCIWLGCFASAAIIVWWL
jgi:hypothetical protein